MSEISVERDLKKNDKSRPLTAGHRNSKSTPHLAISQSPIKSLNQKLLSERPQSSHSNRNNTIPTCRLLQNDIPVVQEIDHKLGNCYCHYCSCKQHICPADKLKQMISSSAYTTVYKNDYTKKLILKSQPYYNYSNNIPLSGKIDFLTIHKRDYRPYSSADFRKSDSKPKLEKNVKFIASTNYTKDFID